MCIQICIMTVMVEHTTSPGAKFGLVNKNGRYIYVHIYLYI